MSEVEIGDVLVITAEDQYYSLLRQGYYLGATLLVSDKYDEHIYTSNSMPWDITNTEDVSVKVYSAPTVIFENLNFVSDLSSRGNYRYFIQLNQCKNSIIRNCNMTTMDNGIRISHSVNTLVEDVTVSKSKYDNSLTGDGYGIYLQSCSNTIIKRVLAICAQGCLDLGGDIPNIDTFVQECNLSSECRAIGIDMHENSYNIVLEDSTFGGVSIFGTATINRCRFIKNNRVPSSTTAIIFRGSHNADWAKLKVTNCIFDGDMQIQLGQHYPQNPISSFDNIFGSVIIKDCEDGDFYYEPETSATVLSNTVNELIIDSWKNCYRIRRSGLIKHLVIRNSTFRHYLWLNDNNADHGVYTDDIEQFDFSSETPPIHRLSVDKDTHAEVFTMTENSPITFSSSNENAKYIVCGKNFVSNNANDYIVGQVTGNVGADLSRTVATYSNPPEVSFDSDGSLIYTQKNNTSSAMVYPFYLVYAKERGMVNLSATLKNISSTDGAGFYPYICIIDCDTGKVSYRGNGTKKTATSEGVTISHSYILGKNHAFIYLFSCSTPVANSISKFENLKCTFTPDFNASAETDEPFIAKRITGNGTITSFDGINNIMSSELNFHVKLKTDNICTPGLSVKDNPVFTGSISMGRTANTTVGTNSVAIGDHCEASAEESHAEGRYTTASGYYSHAEGNYTFATGMGAHAEGMVTIANHANQHAYGEYNVPDSSIASATSRGNYVEIVGNGTAANAQSNARALDWDGNEYLKGDVYVNCNASSGGGEKVATSRTTGIISVEDYGAVGDGITDDATAIQAAVNAGYDIYFPSNKTYYVASSITINHNVHLHGGENTTIKTKTPSGGSAPDGFIITGTLKKTTTLTGDYTAEGSATDNAANRFSLTDMTDIDIGDLMVVTATDQYYNYSRQYYYAGGTLLIAEKMKITYIRVMPQFRILQIQHMFLLKFIALQLRLLKIYILNRIQTQMEIINIYYFQITVRIQL